MHKKLAVYQADNGSIELNLDVNNETIWASLKDISQLFGADKSGISRHIKNIFSEKELDEKSTVVFFATVQTEGSRTLKRTN